MKKPLAVFIALMLLFLASCSSSSPVEQPVTSKIILSKAVSYFDTGSSAPASDVDAEVKDALFSEEELAIDQELLEKRIGNMFSWFGENLGIVYEYSEEILEHIIIDNTNLDIALENINEHAKIAHNIFRYSIIQCMIENTDKDPEHVRSGTVPRNQVDNFIWQIFGVNVDRMDIGTYSHLVSTEDPEAYGMALDLYGYSELSNTVLEVQDDGLIKYSFDFTTFNMDNNPSAPYIEEYRGNFTVTLQLMRDDDNGEVFYRFVNSTKNHE